MAHGCVGTTLSATDNAKLRREAVAFFLPLVHGTLEQRRCSLGSQADKIMQTTDTMDTEFLAASLRPDAVTMRLDPDETLVPY